MATKQKDKKKTKWVMKIAFLSFFLSLAFSVLSELLIARSPLFIAFLLWIVIIFIGIFFDILGTAVTATNEAPFHAKASKKVKGAKESIYLIKNAEKVANICNDVVGDICGIISGAAGSTIIYKLVVYYESLDVSFALILLTGMAATMTIGGKAIGKGFAIAESNRIIELFGRTLSSINQLFKRKK